MIENTAAGGESFADLFEKQTREMKEGEVVQGIVTLVDEDHVQVDVGFKSEGLIDSSRRSRTIRDASSSRRRRPTVSRSGTTSARPTRRISRSKA
jgi:hypothetical protein